MVKMLLVGMGGFLGSAGRYAAGLWISQITNHHSFPFSTFFVNVVGCLVIGILGGLAGTRHVLSEEMRLFLMVGLLGGFTTFSAFGHETIGLVRETQVTAAFLNVFLHVLLGVGAAWLGFVVASYLGTRI